MNHLIIDTETTGFPVGSSPIDWAGQPWPVELAAVLCDDDLRVRSTLHVIVRPPVTIPPDASKIHGITDELAERFGVPPRAATGALMRLFALADVVVGHNVSFDIDIIQSAARRSGVPWIQKPIRCTAAAAAPIVGLPPTERMVAKGMSQPKTPNLGEAVEALCARAHVGAHTALADTTACRDVYAALLARGCWAEGGAS